MPRIRFPQIARHGAIGLSPYAAKYQNPSLHKQSLKPFYDDQVARWRAQVGNSRNLAEPVKNGDSHALSVTCVLDLLLRLHHNEFVYPAALMPHLERDYGHLVQWDAITVGRILSGILSLCLDQPRRPIEFTHHGGARMLVVDEGTLDSWRFLGQLREKAGQRALENQKQARSGSAVPRDEGFWNHLEDLGV
jgi:hypothetical protein